MDKINKIHSRLIIISILIIVLIVGAVVFNIFYNVNNNASTYEINGTTTYNVYGNDGKQISSNLYVSDLAKRIDVNYNYKYDMTNNYKYSYRYEIVSNVISEVDDNNLEEKEVNKESTVIYKSDYKESDAASFIINKNISINYDTYNIIAAKYNQSVNLPIKSKLNLNLNIYIKPYNSKEKKYTSLITIPLEKSTYTVTKNDIKAKDDIKGSKVNSIVLIFNTVILVIIILLILLLIRCYNKYQQYKKENRVEYKFNKIINEYGDIVALIDKIPDHKGLIPITVKEFKSMIDIQNEIHQPILCYKGTKYVVFIIIKDNLAYINFLKEKEEMI